MSQAKSVLAAADLAVRIGARDLAGSGGAYLTVPPGARALIYEYGEFTSDCGPGEHELDSLLARLNRLGQAKDVTAILIRETALPLTFTVQDLPTREFLSIGAELQLGVRVVDRLKFLAGLMEGRERFSEPDLRKALFPWVRQTLKEYIAQRSIYDLNGNANLRGELDQLLQAELFAAFEEYGLGFEGVHTVGVFHAQYDELNRLRERVWLDAERQRAANEAQKTLDDLYDAGEKQRIARLGHEQQRKLLENEQSLHIKTRDIELRERELDLLEQIRTADSREQAIEQGAAEAVARLEHEARQQLGKREDEVLEWEHIRRLAGMKRGHEIALAQIEQEQIQGRARLQWDEENRKRRLQLELDLKKLQGRHERGERVEEIETWSAEEETKLAIEAKKQVLWKDKMTTLVELDRKWDKDNKG